MTYLPGKMLPHEDHLQPSRSFRAGGQAAVEGAAEGVSPGRRPLLSRGWGVVDGVPQKYPGWF